MSAELMDVEKRLEDADHFNLLLQMQLKEEPDFFGTALNVFQVVLPRGMELQWN